VFINPITNPNPVWRHSITWQYLYLAMYVGPALGSTQPPIQWVSGALSPGVKRPGPEVEHSPPNSAEVKKMWMLMWRFVVWYNCIIPLAFRRNVLPPSSGSKSNSSSLLGSLFYAENECSTFFCEMSGNLYQIARRHIPKDTDIAVRISEFAVVRFCTEASSRLKSVSVSPADVPRLS
jgi:hypothetical protein